MALSQGQVEDTLRKAGVDLGRAQEFTSRQDLEGAAGQQKLLAELGGGGSFQAGGDRAAFNQRLRGEEEAFLGKFRSEFPTILTGIEEQLGLPTLRGEAFGALESFKDIPGVQTQAARGLDIGSNQLERIIAAEQTQRQPGVQDLLSSLQFGEEEFGRRAERELVPFETEIGFLKDRFARESTGFNQDAENSLNVLLQKMQNEGALSVAELQQASSLAELEESKRQLK